MSSQLEQLLGYLEREGVTEVLFGSGRPIAMRKAGVLTNITARPLSADQLVTMLRGSEINALIPNVDGEGPTGPVTAGRRTATAQVARRGHEIVVSLTRPEVGAVTSGATQPMAKVATPPTSARAKSATSAPRSKSPTSARAKSPTRSKAPSEPPRTKSGTAVRVKSATLSPRTKAPTAAPRKRTPTVSPATARTTTSTRAGAIVSPTGALVPPAPARPSFDFSLDDSIELGAPIGAPGGGPPGAGHSDGISLGALDGGDFELDLGPPLGTEPPASFDVDFSTNRPQTLQPPSAPPGGFDVDFSTNPPQRFGGAAAPSQARGGEAFANLRETDEGFAKLRGNDGFAKPRQADDGFARPRSDETFAKPRQADDGFARPRSDETFAKPRQPDDGFARPRMNEPPAKIPDALAKTHPLGPPPSHASTQPLASLPPPERGRPGRPSAHEPTQPISLDHAQPIGRTGAFDGRPQEIAHAGTQPFQAISDAMLRSGARVHNPVFTALVTAARELGASDLHIAASRVTSVRTHGELVPIEPGSNPLSAQGAEELLLPLLEPAHEAQLEQLGYVDLALEAPGGGRLRANISRQQQGLKGTFRLALAAPATLDELGLPAELAKVVAHHQGLVVIAGPSGHGKTTTLAALVDLLNSSKPYHILSIEDPVEIVHPRKQAVISQREAGRHTVSFARGLKASLREDPDVIVIGELRDRESVEIALTAAETGHLVIATMSTPSAAKTIDRLIDMFPPEEHSQVRASVAGALRAIVAQRLLPKLGGGIVPAIELVTGVLPLAVLIREDKLYQLPNLMQRGRAFGMIRFDESLAEHVRAGRIDEETALAFAESKKDLAATLKPAAPAATPKTSQLWGFGTKKDR